jgi:flagellar hook-associated protein 3 FlgL
MRITEGMRYRSLLQDISRAQERMMQAQQQVSSGKKILAPSDNPSAAADILRLNSEQMEGAQYLQNLTFAKSRLQVTDSALDTVQQVIERARSLGQSSIGSSLGASSNVTEVNALRDHLVTVANTTHAGRFIFGGSVTTVPPYIKNPDSTVTYQGNAQDMPLQVSRTSSIKAQIAGSEVFSGTINIFDVMADLATAMQTGDKAGIDAQVKKLEQFSDVIATARTKVGGNLNLAASVESELSSAKLARDSQLSREEAADLAAAISELTMSQNGLQATLAVGARISQLSILDYLK